MPIAAVTTTSTALMPITARPWIDDVAKRSLRIPKAETASAHATSTPAAMKNGTLLLSWNVAAASSTFSTAASLTDRPAACAADCAGDQAFALRQGGLASVEH